MLNEGYREACTEVLDIFNHTEQELVDKVPKQLIELMKENASETYRPELDYSKEFNEMGLKQETLNFLAMIYRNYWCTEEERLEFDKLLSENEKKYQAQIYEKYNPDNLFKKDYKENIDINEEPQTNNLPVEVKPEKFYTKIVEFLKRIFRKNK